MSHEFLKLKWNGHMTSFLEIFQSLRSQARYTDATLACEGHLFTVHRLVLASCSPFFDHIFEQTPAENTVIILNDAKAEDIRALLDYMYCGEVEVEQNSLPSFIRTAKCLQVKGLASPDAVEPTRKVSRCSTEPEHGQKRQRSDSYNSFHGKSDASGVIGSSVLMNCNSSKVRNGPRSSSTYSRCGFQRSDLPNTTWSSSASQLDSDKKENESLRCNTTTHRAEPRPIDGCAFVDSCYPSNTLRPSVLQSHLEEPSKFSREYLSENGQLTYSDERPERYIKAEIKQERTDNFIEDLEHNSKTEELEEHSLDYVNNPPVSKDPYEDRYTNHMLQSGGVAFDEQHLHEESFERHADSSNHTAPTTSHSTLSPKLMPYAECSNCFTKNTKLWRRSISGEIVCNACGLYYKLHGVNRPSHLFRSAPMTRRRNPRKKKKYDGCAPRSELCPPEERSDFASSDAYYHEATGEDPDAQDGLAVLNAALTLNSLFAKAKAQEAASRGHGAPHATRPMVDSANGAVGAHDVERNLGHERRRAGTPPSLEIISEPRFTSSMRGVHPYSQSFEVQSQPGNDSSVMEEPEGTKISIYS